MDALLLEVVQTIDDFNLTSSKAVQLGDTEQVPFTENREAGTQLMLFVERRGAAALLKEDVFASIRLEVLHLGVGGLMSGGAAGVSDFPSHRSERVLLSRTLAEK